MTLDPEDMAQFALINMALLALEAAEITEGQAVALTGYDRVALRSMRAASLEAVKERWKDYRFKHPPEIKT